MAMRTATPLVTWSRIIVWGKSIISGSNSTPQFTGPGCIRMASFLVKESRFLFKPNRIAYSLMSGKYVCFKRSCCTRRATECGLARVYPIGAVSKQLKGEELACIGELKEAGVVALSDDGNPIVNSGFLRRALEYAKYFNLPIISHAEDRSLAPAGVMNEGKISTLLGLPGIPAISEEIMVFRDIKLAELTNWHIHIAHVSTAGSIELIRRAKEKKIKVTAETCPHYFTLTEEAAKEFNPNTKVSPPLRTATDGINSC